MAPSSHASHPILFFDGECVLCNRTVLWILDHERHPLVHFAPLNSTTAKQLLHATEWAHHTDSILWYTPGQPVLEASDAALAVAAHLSWPWRGLGAFNALPKSWRDWGYCIIARRRMRWFGRTEQCALLRDVDPSRLLT